MLWFIATVTTERTKFKPGRGAWMNCHENNLPNSLLHGKISPHTSIWQSVGHAGVGTHIRNLVERQTFFVFVFRFVFSFTLRFHSGLMGSLKPISPWQSKNIKGILLGIVKTICHSGQTFAILPAFLSSRTVDSTPAPSFLCRAKTDSLITLLLVTLTFCLLPALALLGGLILKKKREKLPRTRAEGDGYGPEKGDFNFGNGFHHFANCAMDTLPLNRPPVTKLASLSEWLDASWKQRPSTSHRNRLFSSWKWEEGILSIKKTVRF